MGKLFDALEVRFQCPECGKKATHKIRDLKRKDYACPACGIGYENGKFLRDLEKLEASTTNLLVEMGRLKAPPKRQ